MATGNGKLSDAVDAAAEKSIVLTASSSSSESSFSDAAEDVENGRCGCRRCCKRFRDGWHEVQSQMKEPIEEIRVHGRQCLKKSCTVSAFLGKFPIVKWLPKYRLRHFQGDLIAGLTVGLTVIPQGLAYAQVAELSPEYGLYSAFMGCFIYMLLGTSKDITLGPTAIMSLLTGQFGRSPIPLDPTYAILLSFYAGIIQFVMGVLHIGFIVDYISHPVINSFTTAAAITIAWGQVKKWFGLKVKGDFIQEVYGNFSKLPETRLWDFLMGLTCILVLFGMKKMRSIRWGKPEGMSWLKRVVKYIVWLSTTARNAIVVVLASVAAGVFLQHNLKPFSLTKDIKAGLPPFKVPSFSMVVGNDTQTPTEVLANLGSGLIIVPVLGLVETIAIGKAFARKYGYSIDANQELLAVGASNIVGAFVGAYPVTGSFSRTAVNAQSGVMTTAGGLWTAALVLLALAFLTPLFKFIPDAALAAVIIMAVIDMIDFSLLWKLWRVKKIDLIPWIVTFICSLLIGIEWGIIVGIGISLLFILYPWARPNVQVNFVELSNDDMIVMTLNHGLVFPGIEYFKDKVYSKALSGENSKSVVLDFNFITKTDFTAVEGLHHLLEDFAKKNKKLILCNVKPDVLDVFTRAKLKHFEHAASVDEAIALLKEEGKKDSAADDISSLGDEGLPESPVEMLGTPDIERFSIYNDANDANDNDDPTDDESLERNYIVTKF